MSELLLRLKPNQRKGSKPRCHLLTHNTPKQVAEELTKLFTPCGLVTANDKWMPQGFDNLEEAQLHKAERLSVIKPYRQTLTSWWLKVLRSPVTPNWDIASTCTIDGKLGLLLVEAKAHSSELKQNDSCGSKNKENFKRIGEAIRDANDALNKIQHGWNLSHESHYQLCNRFAWSWKLATLGIPVVLVYLGFLNANEMEFPFSDENSWENAVRNYAKDIVPDSVWGSKLMIGDIPIYPLIKSKTIPLN